MLNRFATNCDQPMEWEDNAIGLNSKSNGLPTSGPFQSSMNITGSMAGNRNFQNGMHSTQCLNQNIDKSFVNRNGMAEPMEWEDYPEWWYVKHPKELQPVAIGRTNAFQGSNCSVIGNPSQSSSAAQIGCQKFEMKLNGDRPGSATNGWQCCPIGNDQRFTPIGANRPPLLPIPKKS